MAISGNTDNVISNENSNSNEPSAVSTSSDDASNPNRESRSTPSRDTMNEQSSNEGRNSIPTPDTNTPSARGESSRSSDTSTDRASGDRRRLLKSSYVKFLTRPDLVSFLKNSGVRKFNLPSPSADNVLFYWTKNIVFCLLPGKFVSCIATFTDKTTPQIL